jgi:ABC-type multidrug transport system fused ATPase/permease subunit
VRRLGRAHGAIEFAHVSFSYGGRTPVFEDLTFALQPGERLGISGSTGSGKTTVAALLLRFYDPTYGRVLLDGIDIRDYELPWLRSQCALVPQEPLLFSATIADNIAYGRRDASPADIARAAELAQVDDFILSLPDGYLTLVGERGHSLSGGQRQRIALARALLIDAPILILDEPTSALDGDTEAAVIAALGDQTSRQTMLLISHRKPPLEICDRVVVTTPPTPTPR